MIHKPRVELSQEEIRARTIRAGMTAYAVHIIDLDTHEHVDYLVFSEHPQDAINNARLHGRHAPGSAGQATPIQSDFIVGKIPEISRLA
jgi:hypothetical protein